MQKNRRNFLKKMGALGLGAMSLPLLDQGLLNEIKAAGLDFTDQSAASIAQDESYWDLIRLAYDLDPSFINLENGYYSPAPRMVLDAYQAKIREVNAQTSFYLRKHLDTDMENVRTALGEMAGVDPEEIAVLRNTTEALNILIFGMELKAGDEVILHEMDYGTMIECFKQRAEKDGIVIKWIKLPLVPTSEEDLIKPYRDAITSKTKVVLVTHILNRNGQILPVKKICELGKKAGAEVIVDGAHSFAHFDFKISDLGCDYFGTSLHKWLSAPLGNGFLYIKKEKIEKIWPLMGHYSGDKTDVRKFEHIGTSSPATFLGVLPAIEFYNAIGAKRKEERLRYLKNYWVDRIKDLPGVKINTAHKPAFSCGIGNFSVPAVKKQWHIYSHLKEKHNVWTHAIFNPELEGIRIVPQVFTSTADLDRLVEGVKDFLDNRN